MPSPCILQGRGELSQPTKLNPNPGSFSYQLCEFRSLFPHFELVIIHCGSILYEIELGKFEMMQYENNNKISFVHKFKNNIISQTVSICQELNNFKMAGRDFFFLSPLSYVYIYLYLCMLYIYHISALMKYNSHIQFTDSPTYSV